MIILRMFGGRKTPLNSRLSSAALRLNFLKRHFVDLKQFAKTFGQRMTKERDTTGTQEKHLMRYHAIGQEK